MPENPAICPTQTVSSPMLSFSLEPAVNTKRKKYYISDFLSGGDLEALQDRFEKAGVLDAFHDFLEKLDVEHVA